MKLAILGGVDCPYIDIAAQITNIPTEILTCRTTRVDTAIKRFSNKSGIPLIEYEPNFDKYGNSAVSVRNRLIVEDSDCLLVFFDNTSVDTKEIILYADELGKPIKVVPIRYSIPDGLKLRIWHKLQCNHKALDYCEKLAKAELQYSKLTWIQNQMIDDQYGRIIADITIDTENYLSACKEILLLFGKDYCFIHLFQKSFYEKRVIKKWKNILQICNCPIKGGLIVKERHTSLNSENSFEDLKTVLENISFYNITKHTEQISQYKVDFDTYLIDYKVLSEIKGFAISIEYPGFTIDREADKWYQPDFFADYEIKAKVLKQKSYIDISGDDSSLDRRFW